MGAPIVYRWDDDQAPVARGERESFIEILTACLVDGYGTKAAAGWTKEFENVDGTMAAFRNNPTTGTGMFLQIDAVNTINPEYCAGQGFETMTDESTGTGPFSDNSIDARCIYTSYTGGTTPNPWVLIADDRSFYYFCEPFGDAAAVPSQFDHNFFFGDIISLYDSDPYACGMCHLASSLYNRASEILYVQVSSAADRSGIFLARNVAGDVGLCSACSVSGGGPHPYSVGQSGAPFGATYPTIIGKIHVNDGAPYTMRGSWPGLYYPCHAFPYSNMEAVSVDGQSFIAINSHAGTNDCQCLISVDNYFRP